MDTPLPALIIYKKESGVALQFLIHISNKIHFAKDAYKDDLLTNRTQFIPNIWR